MKLRKRSWTNADGSRGVSWFVDWTERGERKRHRFDGIVSKKHADLAFSEFRLRHERGKLAIPTEPGITIEECLDGYYAGKEANSVKRHASTLKSRVEELKRYFGKDRTILSITESAVNEFKNAQRLKEIAPPTLNKKIGLLKAAIDKSVRDGLIATSPIQHVENVSDPRPEAWRFLHEEEIEQLLSVLRDGAEVEVKPKNRKAYKTSLKPIRGLYALAVTLLNTGARLGEALALRWSDIDLKAGTICLVTTKGAARGKKAKPRFITINSALRELLEAMPKEGEKVFRVGVNVERKFCRAVALAKIGHCRIHDLRHTFASHLAMRGVALNTIREMLGHSTMTMTLRYAHLLPKVTAEAVETLNFGASGKVAKIVPIAEAAG